MFQDKKIRYFSEPGPQNCEALIETIKERTSIGTFMEFNR